MKNRQIKSLPYGLKICSFNKMSKDAGIELCQVAKLLLVSPIKKMANILIAVLEGDFITLIIMGLDNVTLTY